MELRGKYLSLTTYKRDGTGVATPVWFVADGERLLVKTDPASCKVRRIRHNPAVTIAPCGGTGRLRGPAVSAYAEILPDAALPLTDELMARKYRVDRVLVLPLYWLVQRLKGKPRATEEVVLAITPVAGEDASPEPAQPGLARPAQPAWRGRPSRVGEAGSAGLA